MLALHISFIDSVPHIWGETSLTDAPLGIGAGIAAGRTHASNTGMAGSRSKTASSVTSRKATDVVHPFAANRRQVLAAIDAMGLIPQHARAKLPQMTVWLPAWDGVPVASTPLLGVQQPASQRKPSVAPFLVDAIPLELDDVLIIGDAIERDDETVANCVPSTSIRWCTAFLRTIIGVVAAGQVLPGVHERDRHWESRWVPYPDEETQHRLIALADAMPSVCRCMTQGAKLQPEASPRTICNELEHGFTDRFMRWTFSDTAPRIGSIRSRIAHNSVHDAWLASLASEAPGIAWTADADVAQFAGQLHQWSRRVHMLARAPFTFCLRVSEPDPAATRPVWMIEYLLKPKSDPSLLLPLGGAWTHGSREARQLAKFGDGGLEFALMALGQAAGLSAAIARSLQAREPVGAVCTSDELLHFLETDAYALNAAGFDVMLPAWWTRAGQASQGVTLTVHAHTPAMTAAVGGSLDVMQSFDLGVALAGEKLTLAELRALAKLKGSLVAHRGKWTLVDQDAIARAIRVLGHKDAGEMSGRELVALALGAERTVGGLEVGSVQADGWLGELISGLKSHDAWTLLPQPQKFTGTLRPYQLRGFSWLAFLTRWRLGACLADDMGLGKTVQMLALIQHQRNAGEHRPVVLVCPTSVMNNWAREAASFTPGLSVHVHHGVSRAKHADFIAEVQRHAIVVCSYGLLQRDAAFLAEVDWAGAVFDEAQFLKNAGTKQAKAARGMRAAWKCALTGTPVENHVGDLWSMMDLLNPGLLGTWGAFRTLFHRPIHMYADAASADRLRALTGPFILRRMKTDTSIISDLPDKLETREYCTLTREQATLYQAVLDDMERRIVESSGIKRRGLVLTTLLRLKQVCNHPALMLGDGSAWDGRSGKLARLEEMLLEIRGMHERTLIFTQFTEMGAALQEWAQRRFREEVLYLHGAVPRKRRDEMVARFQSDEQAPHVFVLSLRAGGTGLNLTRANHVVHFDRWWNPAVETQATDRAFRIGQQKNVYVRTCIVAGTLEDSIDAMIEKKRAVAASVVGAGEQWLTELANDELFSLLRLGKEAMGDA